jgi:hypothetical protein
MGEIADLIEDIRDEVQTDFDDLLESFGKDCTLVYPGIFVECPNCIYDPIGQKSTNIWKHGGPAPFSSGACPVCGGTGGYRETEPIETIKVTVNWSPQAYIFMPGNIRVPANSFLVRGYLTDAPKLKQANQIILQADLDGLVHYRCRLYAEPFDQFQIVQRRYFLAILERIES